MPETVSKLYRALVFDERVSLAVLDTTARRRILQAG